jgi:hypothetical protein
LIELGYGEDALTLVRAAASRLAPRDSLTLALEASTALKWNSVLRTEFAAAVARPLTSAQTEVLCAYLVRHPDPELLELLFTAWQQAPLAARAENYSAFTALACAAGANGDIARVRAVCADLKPLVGPNSSILASVEAFFTRQNASARIESYLTAFQPLPVDVTYALLERYYRPQSTATAKANR